MPTFKLPSSVFATYTEFFKYKLGLIKFTQKEILEKVGFFLSNNFGLKKIIRVKEYSPDLPKINGFTGVGAEDWNRAFGQDFLDDDVALSKMYGEFLERQIFIQNDKNVFTNKLSIQELKTLFNVSFPHDFHKPKNLVDENLKIDCVQVEDLSGSKKVFYPKQIIFYGKDNSENIAGLYPKNSNGCAGWFTLKGATIKAILELTERESFLLHWLTKTSCNEILPITKNTIINSKLEEMDKYGLSLRFFDLKTDIGLPVVLCVTNDNLSKVGKKVISLGSGFSYEEAILRAINESYQLLFLLKEGLELSFLENDKKVSLTDLDSKFKISSEDIQYQYLLNLINKSFPDSKIYRYKSSNFGLKSIGYFVVRVIIPQLLPFYLDQEQAMIKSKRILQFLKYKGKDLATQINKIPHPFV